MTAKNREGLISFITWMRSGGCEVDVRRRGPTTETLDHPFKCFTAAMDLETLAWLKLLIFTGKELAFEFICYVFEYWSLLSTSTLRPLMWWMRPGLPRFFFFALFRFHVLYWMQTEEQKKNRGGLETRLNPTIKPSTEVGAAALGNYMCSVLWSLPIFTYNMQP